MLIDSDLAIEHLRGRPSAGEWMRTHVGRLAISAMTVAELYQGVRDGNEVECLERMLRSMEVLPVTTSIAEKGGLFSRKWRKSHGCGLADCLIAATAEEHGLALATFNAKHYPMLERIEVPYKR